MKDKVQIIRDGMVAAQSRQKSYADTRRIDLSFEKGDWVYLKVSPMSGIKRFWKKMKLSPRIALPEYFGEVHDVFHVSSLKKSFRQHEPRLVDLGNLQLQPNLTFEVASMQIVDWKEQRLRSKTTALMKVSWGDSMAKDFTWEREANMKEHYPYLFGYY
ncbi:hypothetical protein F2P56_021074 [Juglans regia]|uniref:Uncharacterized protein LOC108992154 n=2 Tax=Juglans regia TaxID=51240 RepID=A0A2I4ERZ2_JUGRE|nr:uncharacterized protein LOC108992154 [Juglans regia]KAF5461263.1 hypothetical protein F2P56_021074 [Juglans regia]